MSEKKSSRSKVPFFLESSQEPSLFDVADETCPWKSFLIPFWNTERTGWSEHDPSLRKDVSTSDNFCKSVLKGQVNIGPSIQKWKWNLESMSNCFTNSSSCSARSTAGQCPTNNDPQYEWKRLSDLLDQ